MPDRIGPARSEAVIDLDAIRHNVENLRSRTTAAVLAAVKADAYGHGIVPVARAVLAGGASWLGVAFLEEAFALRDAGIDAPILAWLAVPGEPLDLAISRNIDVSVSAMWFLDEVAGAARLAGRPARVHLDVDTGLSRGGSALSDWADLVTAAAKTRAAGEIEIVSVWSHFARADEPGQVANGTALATYLDALEVAERRGVVPEIRHMANSAALMTAPESHFDLVRPGIALYGLSPGAGISTDGLVPAMTLRTRVALSKRVPAGSGVSYGHDYQTPVDTRLALVPLGYGDGVPRNGGDAAPVWVAGDRYRVAGRVCMDQFVVDVGEADVRAGDEVILFGPGDDGEPTVADWAEATGTITNEIVTRIGARVPRRYLGAVA